ncbi:MAG: peptidoglycan D,D-transpeptidase FtsI family protein [Planctomycetota bacterium]|jgi:cell division protein FtsI/penicillin-binding protein 2
MDPTQTIQARRVTAWTGLLVVGMLLALLVLLGRTAQLKLLPSARLREHLAPRVSSRPELARRGDLLDSRGRVLATTTVGYRLFVDPADVEDLQTIAVDLGALIGAPPVELDKKILGRTSPRYAVVDHLLEPPQADAVRKAQLAGVGLEPRLVRRYPNGEAGAAVVGLVGFEHTGLSGAEHVFDERLAPREGRLTYLRDARRKALWIEPSGYRPGDDGRDVHLSIDLVIQRVAERHLALGVERHNAGGGRVVVLDCRSGEILALSDVLGDRTDAPTIRDPARAIHPALGRSRCVSDPYEPGSTMKPFVWATVTEMGRADPGEIIQTPENGPHRTGYGRLVRDVHSHGAISWRDVLVRSSNAGMSMAVERLGHDELREAIGRFGFGAETGCGVPGESPGLVTPPSRWSRYTQTSVAMGHEIAVTPVQLVTAFSAFARDGTLAPIRITAEDPGGMPFAFRRRACSEAVADLVRRVLRQVVVEGTGRPAQSQRYRLFGKSGTAQLPDPVNGGYHENRYVANFIAGAPLKEPRVVVLCVIDDPDKSRGHYGGRVAGPIVRDIIDETLEYLGVPPDNDALCPTYPNRIEPPTTR